VFPSTIGFALLILVISEVVFSILPLLTWPAEEATTAAATSYAEKEENDQANHDD
jgi:hypothetical protein